MDIEQYVILIQHILTALIGIIGNVFVLIVYSRKLKDNEIITLFILNLALSDLACCAFLLPINCYIEIVNQNIYSDFLCKFHQFLNITNITFSCFLMTLVAFERYFSIIWPLHKILTKFRAKCLACILLLICVLYALFGSLAYGIYHPYEIVLSNSTTNITIDSLLITKIVNKSNSFKNNWMLTNHCSANNLIISYDTLAYLRSIQNFIPVISFIIIFILYAFIFVSVCKRRQLKKERASYYRSIVRRSRQFSTINQTSSTITTRNSTACYRQSFLDVINNTNHNASMNSLSIVPQRKPNGIETKRLTPLYVSNSKTNSTENFQQFEMEPINVQNRVIDVPLSNSLSNLTKEIEKEKLIDDTQKDSADDGLLKPSFNISPTKSTSLSVTNPLTITNVSNDSSNTKQPSNSYYYDNCQSNTDLTKALQHKKSLGDQIDHLRTFQTFQQQQTTQFNTKSILIANVKTAFMLFVVSAIMVIVYTPALLISFHIIDYQPVLWNLYFFNHAANPLVYSFLNSNFRNSLKSICSNNCRSTKY